MKIDLTKKIPHQPGAEPNLQVEELLSQALWNAKTGGEKARELYEKIKGKEEVDLTAKENANLQDAIKGTYIAGIEWQLIDILEGKDG